MYNTPLYIFKYTFLNQSSISQEYPRYKYGYSVHDPKTKDIKSAWEHRDGDVTHGEYSLVEPDGAIRIVKYVVDKDKGFQAIVDRIPPPQSKEKSTQSFGHNFGPEKSSSLSAFNDDKFQSYYNPPQKNFDFNSAHFQIPNIKDFHQQNEKPFTSSQADYQDFSAEMKGKKQNQFSSQQKESEEDEEEESEEEEDGDEDKDNENEKENVNYAGPGHQSDVPAYNYQTQNLQDVSHHYNIPNIPSFENHQPYHQNFNPNPNQLRTGFDFSPLQQPFKPSQRDFSETGFQDLNAIAPKVQPVQYNPVNVHSTGYFPKPPQGKTASYQSIQYNTPNYNTPNEHTHEVIHTNPNNIPASPLENLPPHEINMDKYYPAQKDTYYPTQNGNYKFSQPQVQTPLVGKVLTALNAPPAHSFPSTSHLLIPPQEKLPNYNENQNTHSSHAQFNLPPPGTPISHNHHHEGEFERYD
ncbi:hypothetical protein WDU94_009048 [Cyamophila willieti]